MTLSVFAAVLLAAALHAGWNALVKSGGDTLLTTALVTGSAALLAGVALPFLPSPVSQSWPFIAASTSFQVVYFVLVARVYRVAEMSLAYPLMRGTAPMLIALASVALLGELLPVAAWLGIGIICAGILSMAGAGSGGADRAGIIPALGNAVVIAGYTLIDGIGVRRSGAPAAYTLWVFLLTGTMIAIATCSARRSTVRSYIRHHWRSGLVGAVGTIGSYGLALWAMTRAPIAMVAALRETSILMGTGLSALLFHERVGGSRMIGVGMIALGAVLLRLG